MKTILIVDDEVLICKILKEYFELNGYNTFAAFTGQEALNSIKKEKPNLILLDIGLPDISGIELLPMIKAMDPNIKIIIISAYSEDEENISRAKLQGVNDYVVKPFSLTSLQEIVFNKMSD
ncbi:MAG: hypothetical protein A2539_02825 [Elusimicrobia bacterium RIFOXYD2_FULL_34_15]|nr:MAG: hypothetical protein A2539_02825 [Elusimicrobia bacterium RIFOXYD2_FULL_34_15]